MNVSPDKHSLRDYQARFAARIRDPRGQARPKGVPARRMRVYEELLFNNLEGFLLACYPVTRKLLGARAWRRLAKRFFAEHRCDSPLFRDIPRAFLAWMQANASQAVPDRPYLYELMHYEWLELAVAIDPVEDVADGVERDGDLLEDIPVLNPTTRLASYRYPVHEIRPRFRPAPAAGHDHHYLVYRDREHQVRFTTINALTLQLLLSLRNGNHTGRETLLHMAGGLAPDQINHVLAMGQDMLLNLRKSGAVTGVRNTGSTRHCERSAAIP
ncbi:MAG: DUF2063 domain-containing protein [Gammaproteobacteria bacterium]